MQREISTLKETVTMTQKEISMLKESDTMRQKEVSTLKEAVTMMQKEISTFKERVTMVENEFLPQLTALDRRIGHLELRNAQKDIADVNAREVSISDESVTTKVDIPCEAHTSTKSTNSAPFFSDAGDCGYQMCINLSRSEGLNPELTFALVLMRGKFDKNLHWPFSRKIILTVISNDASKHHVITIQPKSEKSFQRPKSDLNEPFAFLKKHYTVLFDGGFINDDKVAIQVTVT